MFIRPDVDASGEMLVPSLLWATGHGFSSAALPPPVMEFLEQKRAALDPAEVPVDVGIAPAQGKFVQDRHYMLWAIALIWRVLGISWAGVRLYVAIVFAAMAAILYGIFRLGTNRPISVVGTALCLLSPAVLSQLPYMRSISKAPFLLGTLLTVAYVLKRETRPRTFLALALVQGLVLGFGLGFRQDIIMGLPPALLAFALGTGLRKPPTFQRRGLAIAVLLAGFIVPAWPTLHMTGETGGNNAFYLTQGFALCAYREAGLERGAFCPLYTRGDPIVHAAVIHYDKATNPRRANGTSASAAVLAAQALTDAQIHLTGSLPALALTAEQGLAGNEIPMWSKEAEIITRRMVRYLYTMFTGDVVARAYGAVLRVLRKLPVGSAGDERFLDFFTRFNEPIDAHFAAFGIWYALVTLIVISAARPRDALIAVCLLVYFCGYTSLQFESRHAFHFIFATYWFPACLLGIATAGLQSLIRSKAHPRQILTRIVALWRPSLLRIGAFVFLCAGALLLPLGSARAFQHHQLRPFASKYSNAELVPLATTQREHEGRPLTCPLHIRGFGYPILRRLSDAIAQWRPLPLRATKTTSEYLMAEIEIAEGEIVRLDLFYDGRPEFSGNDWYRLPSGSAPVTVRYFFPVHDIYEGSSPRSEFIGISVSPNARIKALYQVQNKLDFPILMNAWIPEDPRLTRWHLGIPLWEKG